MCLDILFWGTKKQLLTLTVYEGERVARLVLIQAPFPYSHMISLMKKNFFFQAHLVLFVLGKELMKLEKYVEIETPEPFRQPSLALFGFSSTVTLEGLWAFGFSHI